MVFGGQSLGFSRFFRANTFVLHRNSGFVKIAVLPRFFHGFWHVARVAHREQKRQKIASGVFREGLLLSSVQVFVLGLAAVDFVQVWDAPGCFLGDSWAVLGALGRFLGALGRLFGTSWTTLGCSWEPFGGRMLSKMGSRSILDRF